VKRMMVREDEEVEKENGPRRLLPVFCLAFK